MRHHVLAVDLVIDDKVLHRFDLDDDEILASCGAEGWARSSSQGRSLREPVASLGHLTGCRPGPEQRRARVGPCVVEVVAERSELFHHGAIPEHLIELAAAQDRRGRHSASHHHDDEHHRGGQPDATGRRIDRLRAERPDGQPQGKRQVEQQPQHPRRDQASDRRPHLSGLSRGQHGRRRQHVSEEPVVDRIAQDHERAQHAPGQQHSGTRGAREKCQAQQRWHDRGDDNQPVRHTGRFEERFVNDHQRLREQRRRTPGGLRKRGAGNERARRGRATSG